jgi:hypothetical protein
MGNWPPEDVEGPFGFVHHHPIPDSFFQHLNTLSPLRPVDNGLTVWTQGLPFQLKSPLIREQITQRNIFSPEAPEVLSTVFERNWLRYFCSQWASKFFYENFELAPEGAVNPYQKDFSVRFPSRTDGDKIREHLSDRGVRVLRKTDIIDFSFGGRLLVSGFELQGEEKGIQKYDDIIWCLSSEETRHFSRKISDHLFSDVLEPQWTWVRFRVEFSDCEELNALPLHFNMIDDLFSSWTHANWIIGQRTALKKQFDFWMRIPGFQRFNRNYLTKIGEKLKKILSQNLTESYPEILSYPQEYYYAYDQMGPSRWVQYERIAKKFFPVSTHFKNVYFSTPETWSSNQWIHRYENEQTILKNVYEKWQKVLSNERRNEVDL